MSCVSSRLKNNNEHRPFLSLFQDLTSTHFHQELPPTYSNIPDDDDVQFNHSDGRLGHPVSPRCQRPGFAENEHPSENIMPPTTTVSIDLVTSFLCKRFNEHGTQCSDNLVAKLDIPSLTFRRRTIFSDTAIDSSYRDKDKEKYITIRLAENKEFDESQQRKHSKDGR